MTSNHILVNVPTSTEWADEVRRSTSDLDIIAASIQHFGPAVNVDDKNLTEFSRISLAAIEPPFDSVVAKDGLVDCSVPSVYYVLQAEVGLAVGGAAPVFAMSSDATTCWSSQVGLFRQ